MRHEFRDCRGLILLPPILAAALVTLAGVIGATYR